MAKKYAPVPVQELTPEKIQELHKEGLEIRRDLHERMKPMTNPTPYQIRYDQAMARLQQQTSRLDALRVALEGILSGPCDWDGSQSTCHGIARDALQSISAHHRSSGGPENE